LDPVTHLVFGQSLYHLLPRASTERGAAAAFLVGSVLPDLDAVLVPLGMDIYLVEHEAGTHSLAGSAPEAAVLAAGLSLTLRGARFVPLFLASWLAVLGHLFLDLADGGGVRILSPLSEMRFGWHLVSMWDPLVVVPLLVMFLAMVIQPSRRRLWAGAAMVVLGLVVGTKAVSRETADRLYAENVLGRGRDENVELRRREEVGGSVFRWRYFDRKRDRQRVWLIDSWESGVTLAFERPVPGDDEVVVASRRFPVVQNLLRISQLPVVWLEKEEDRLLVHWSDMRFCDGHGCPMSFGVALDEQGTPLWQFVDMGGFRRKRPIPSEFW